MQLIPSEVLVLGTRDRTSALRSEASNAWPVLSVRHADLGGVEYFTFSLVKCQTQDASCRHRNAIQQSIFLMTADPQTSGISITFSGLSLKNSVTDLCTPQSDSGEL